MSLRLRLTLTYSVLLGVILVVLGTVLHTTMRLKLEAEMDRRLEVRANQVELTIWPGTQSLRLEDLTSARLDLSSLESLRAPGVFVEVLDRSGNVVAASSNLLGGPALADQQSLSTSLDGRRVLSNVVDEGGRIMRVLNIPIVTQGNVVGVLAVGQSRETLQETMDALLVQLLVLGALALSFAGLVGSVVARRGLEPLGAMARRAASITARRDFSQRLQLGGPRDEVRRLARTIDELLATVDATLRQHRDFLADTSHELRNPLLALRTNLEILDRVASREERAECVQEAKEQVERMSRLVSDLLLLARVETVHVIDRKPLFLRDVVDHVLRAAQVRAEGRTIRLERMDSAEVVGDEDRLSQIVTNLVDNALVHTGPEAEVALRIERENGWVKLSVADTGGGIPADKLSHVFDRFYRGDQAASKGAGTGLGLAIVKHLAEAHGGRVTAESEVGLGSRFTVWLRVREDADHRGPGREKEMPPRATRAG